MKNEKPTAPFEERNVKIRVTRLSNGYYQMPRGHEPAHPFSKAIFEEFERTGCIHWKTHEIDELPYRKAKFQQHLADRLAQIVVAKHANIEPKD
jgi:hypothetical protein